MKHIPITIRSKMKINANLNSPKQATYRIMKIGKSKLLIEIIVKKGCRFIVQSFRKKVLKVSRLQQQKIQSMIFITTPATLEL